MSRLSPVQAEMMRWPVLKPIDPPPGMGAVALNKPVCVVGARNRVHLPLPSPLVSNAHALIVNGSDGVYLRDLVSTNHVYLNDEPVKEAVLHDGDVVRIGPFAFRCDTGFSKGDPSGDGHAAEARVRVDGGEVDLPLNGHAMVVGSREGCDIQLDGIGIAPAHAVIFERDGKHFVRDLGVKTRTYLNDERVYHESALTPSDRIKVGNKTLVYEEGTAPAAVAAATDEEELISPVWDELETPEPQEATEVPLAPDDSITAASSQPAAASASAPAIDLGDSGPIPLLADDDEPSAPGAPTTSREAAPPPPPAPEPVAEAPPEPADELSDEPAEEDSELNVALAEPFPVEHDLAPAAHEAEPVSADEPIALDEPEVPVDRNTAERHFTRMLDDLEEQVAEVNEAWKEIRSSPEAEAEFPGHRAEEPADEGHEPHRHRARAPQKSAKMAAPPTPKPGSAMPHYPSTAPE